MPDENLSTQIDLQTVDRHGFHAQWRERQDVDGWRWELLNSHGEDYLGSRLKCQHRLHVHGSLGDYCFVGLEGPEVEIDGDVDAAAGQAIQAGSLLIRGQAGAGLGSFGKGGWIAVTGSVGARCGAGLCGAEIIVQENAGPQLGCGMNSGTILVGGSAGSQLGKGMVGGMLFVRGEVESLAPGVEEMRLKEADRFRIGLLLLKAGVSLSSQEFRGYRKADI